MEQIRSRDHGGVKVVTLNRPERLNAFTPSGYRDLRIALDRAADEPNVNAVLLEGNERAFSAGADLNFLRDAASVEAMRAEFGHLLTTLNGFTKPLIAAASGAVVGFGATLLLHCDVVLLSTDARLRFPFADLGTVPEAGSSWLLPETVGLQRAMELILSARWLSADEAVTMGLAVRTLPFDQLGSAALGLARSIADMPGPAVVAAKALLRGPSRDEVQRAIVRENLAAAALAEMRGGALSWGPHPTQD